jgi:N-acetylneuraminic acid mutarotase
MLVWGGTGYEWADHDGAFYLPTTDSWRKIPRRPLDHSEASDCGGGAAAAWTGKELVTWGGWNGQCEEGKTTSAGAAFVPDDLRWRTLSNPPVEGRAGAASVWTGREVVFWSGWNGKLYPEDGAAYDPARDKWRRIAPAPISGRGQAAAVWSGREVIVWGGADELPDGSGGKRIDGAAYDPVTDSWRLIPQAPLNPRSGWRAVWAGNRLVVWGGVTWKESLPSGSDDGSMDPQYHADGAAYDPGADEWTTLPVGPLAPRAEHTLLWTGSEVLFWGGAGRSAEDSHLEFADGAVYRPADGA